MKNFKAPELQTDEKQPPKCETEKPIDWANADGWK